jgi:hypothetical protein
LGIGLAGVNFKDPYGLLEDPAALRATEPHEAVTADASGQRLCRERMYLDDRPDGIVAEAANEVAADMAHLLNQPQLAEPSADAGLDLYV